MRIINETTALLCNGHLTPHGYSNGEQPQPHQKLSHCIDVLEKPLLNGYVAIHDEDSRSADLSLEELLPFLDDPWWQQLRRILFGTFVLVFWLILFTACGLAYMQQNKVCGIPTAGAPIPTAANATMSGVLQKM